MNNLMKFSVMVLGLIVVLILIAPYAYHLWIGDVVAIPVKLTISMAVFFVVQITYLPFHFFINGVGKIRLQMYTLVLATLFNISLSIVLVNYFGLRVKGVIMAPIICILPT